MRYYDLIETACVAQYDATMDLLNEHYANHVISLPEYQYWKLETENELQRAYQNIDAMAYAFARIDEDDMDKNTQAIAAKLKSNDMLGAMALASNEPYETVLQAYSDFSTTFPMARLEDVELKAGLDSLPVGDSLYNEIVVLQTYANLFESDFVTSGEKYGKSCVYLGVIYKERGWEEASRKYFQKALRMYEMLSLIEGVEMDDRIDRIKELLENK